MDKEACGATVHSVAESDTDEATDYAHCSQKLFSNSGITVHKINILKYNSELQILIKQYAKHKYFIVYYNN